jgi:hypothetical protein
VNAPVHLPPALQADLVELLAQLVVATRRRRLASERTDPLGGTTVTGQESKADSHIGSEAAR